MAKTTPKIELLDSVLDVDFSSWYKTGIRLVCLDVDGTITPHNGRVIDPMIVRSIQTAAGMGMRFVLLTNNIFYRRLKRMQKAFGGKDIIIGIYSPRYLLDRKPGRVLFKRLYADQPIKPTAIGVVGNTYGADVLAAQRAGVGRIAWVNGYPRRSVLHKAFIRPYERWHRRRLEKKS